jgi:hypothetical protein
MTILALFYLILSDILPYGYFSTSITIGVSDNGFNSQMSIDILPFLMVAAIFFISQI